MAKQDASPVFVSRKQAIESGLKQYFHGNPCPNRHVSPRYVSSRACVECSRLRKNIWAVENVEHVAQYNSFYSALNADNLRAAHAIYRANHREQSKRDKRNDYHRHRAKRKAAQQRYRENNRTKLREIDRRKVATDPQRYAAYKRNRKARVKNAHGSHTGADIAEIFRLQRGCCAYCRTELKNYHVDHIQPIVKGGSNGRENLQLLCRRCNQTKSARDPIEFAQQRGMLL